MSYIWENYSYSILKTYGKNTYNKSDYTVEPTHTVKLVPNLTLTLKHKQQQQQITFRNRGVEDAL